MSVRVWRWAAVAAYMALIFTVSSLPIRLGETAQKFHGDWLAHIVEYGVLGVLLCRAFTPDAPRTGGTVLILRVMAIGILYGLTDEFHQRFVPMRDSNLLDLVADAAGLALGTWIWFKLRRKSHA